MHCLLEVSIALTTPRTNHRQTEVQDQCSDRHSQVAIQTTAVGARLFWTQHSMVNRFDQTKTLARLPKLALGTTHSSHLMAANRTILLTPWLIKTSSLNCYLHSSSNRNKGTVLVSTMLTISKCLAQNRALTPWCRVSSFRSSKAVVKAIRPWRSRSLVTWTRFSSQISKNHKGALLSRSRSSSKYNSCNSFRWFRICQVSWTFSKLQAPTSCLTYSTSKSIRILTNWTITFSNHRGRIKNRTSPTICYRHCRNNWARVMTSLAFLIVRNLSSSRVTSSNRLEYNSKCSNSRCNSSRSGSNCLG